ncbi:MAG: transcriptional regulator, partial [Actinobacteria bacterium]|nr:transcriptional regulator [Actinomycetota bacterium]
MVLLRTHVGGCLRAARTLQGRTLRDVAADARVSLG